MGGLLLATETTTIGTGTAAATMTITALANTKTSSSGNSSANCPADKTAVVGGAVGGALGAALLASLGALAFVLMRRRSAAAGPAQGYTNYSQYATRESNQMVGSSPPQKQYASMQGGHIPPTELPVERDRPEM